MARKNRKPSQVTSIVPDGCQHYADVADVPWDLQRYFEQRYSIFSRYDDGIWMTEDAWFGITPEPVAIKIAEHISDAATPEKAIIIDCFAGVGGNTIAFACSGRWKRVYAIEKDSKTLACAKHNAEIYGVQDQISWFEGDCFKLLETELADLNKYCVTFASPPWGGPGYRTDDVFDLSTMQPYNLHHLVESFRKHNTDIVLYLPRTSDMRQLAKATQGSEKTIVMHYCMEGASKAVCAYYGSFKFQQSLRAS